MGVLKSNRISTPDQVPFFRLKTVHLVVHLISKSVHSKVYMYSFRSIEVVHVQQKSRKVVQKLYMYSFFSAEIVHVQKQGFHKIVHIFGKYVHVQHQKRGAVWTLRERIG